MKLLKSPERVLQSLKRGDFMKPKDTQNEQSDR